MDPNNADQVSFISEIDYEQSEHVTRVLPNRPNSTNHTSI